MLMRLMVLRMVMSVKRLVEWKLWFAVRMFWLRLEWLVSILLMIERISEMVRLSWRFVRIIGIVLGRVSF